MSLFHRFRDRERRPRRPRANPTSAPSFSQAARDIVGPLGWVRSNAWQELHAHGQAYQNSFDRRVPPSLFVSERDRTRANMPVPVPERCIEDWHENRSRIDEAASEDG